jgi:TATA-box binding protein (TBP) (component of TFIID and TFIIIB)
MIVNVVRICRSTLSFEEVAKRFEAEVHDSYLVVRLGGASVTLFRSGKAIVTKTGDPPEWLTECRIVNIVGVRQLPPLTEEELLEIAERYGIKVDRTERSPGYTAIMPEKKTVRIVLGSTHTIVIYFAKSFEEAERLEEAFGVFEKRLQ